MKIKSRTTTEDYLRKTQLPLATKTYTVIPHGVVIDAIREKLKENGFIVTNELYKSEYNGDIAMGFMHIENDSDPDMGMTFNFTNSYNKMLKFGCSVGGFIYDNEVPFLTSNNSASWIRKHTGTALDEAMNVIDAMISCANEHFQEVIDMKERLKAIQVDKKEYAKLIGLLYLDKEILFADQVGVIKNEYKKPSFDYKDKGTLWEIYKMIMYAIAEKSPKIWHEQQMKISAYIQVMYNFASQAVANEDQTLELDFAIEEQVTDNQEVQEEIEIIPNLHQEEIIDLDAEEDAEWDKLEEAGIITPCAGHDVETVKDEMESIDNLIQAQNLIQDAKSVATEEPSLFADIDSKKERLEEIREEIQNESVSYGELVELQELTEYIEDGDVELLEAAGVPEFVKEELIDLSDLEGEYTLEEMPEVIEVIEEAKAVMSEEQIEMVKEEHGIIEKGNPDDGLIGSTENVESLFDLVEEEDDDNDEVPWFTNENPQMQVAPSLIPDAIRTGVDAIITELYGNKRKVTSVIEDASGKFVVELDSHEFFVVD